MEFWRIVYLSPVVKTNYCVKSSTKIVLRQYPKTFEWESLEKWNERTNEELKGLNEPVIALCRVDSISLAKLTK